MEGDDGDDPNHHVDYVVGASCIFPTDHYDIDNDDNYDECGAYGFGKDRYKPHRISYSPSPRIKNNIPSLFIIIMIIMVIIIIQVALAVIVVIIPHNKAAIIQAVIIIIAIFMIILSTTLKECFIFLVVIFVLLSVVIILSLLLYSSEIKQFSSST